MVKSPTGRLTNLEPEIQYLGRRHYTVAEHTKVMMAIDFSGLELRLLAHELDEYQTRAAAIGVNRDKAMEIFEEERIKGMESPTSRWEDVIEAAWRRLIKP